MLVASDRRYELPAEPADVFATMASVGSYRKWWPWLEAFDAKELAAGEQWRCTVRPPLPYRVRFVVTLEDVVEPSLVTATVSGDITGTARIELVPAPSGGSTLRLRASLAPSSTVLQLLSRVARPVVRFGHDWVIDTGARQFAQHLDHHRGPGSGAQPDGRG